MKIGTCVNIKLTKKEVNTWNDFYNLCNILTTDVSDSRVIDLAETICKSIEAIERTALIEKEEN